TIDGSASVVAWWFAPRECRVSLSPRRIHEARSSTTCGVQGRRRTALKCEFRQIERITRDGAEEGTRTPTPLRAHGPEPCASANSATSAWCADRRSATCAAASWARNY